MSRPGAPSPGPRTLTMRQWMLVGLGIFALTAALFYHLAGLVDQGVVEPWMQRQPAPHAAALDAALRGIAGSPGRWRDPAWQAAERAALAPLDAQVLISDPAGAPIFRSGAIASGAKPLAQTTVVEARSAGPALGTVALYAPAGGGFPVPVPVIAALLAVTLALLFVRLQMGRYVIRPLEAMGVAARRIAAGNLEFDLPVSRVREVADVSAAFTAMGAGLRDSLQRQAALEEERRFFVGAIAHDLRTPLFALRGYLEGLDQGLATSPARAAGYLAICRQKADQLDRLVSDLFAYTRVEYLEQTLQTAPLDLAALLRRAVASAAPGADAKGVTLTVNGPLEPCAVQGDGPLLERAVENLLDNAIRYTPAGGRVGLCCRRDASAGQAVVSVADTGPGIAAADLPHLFDPLFRGEASRSRQTGGAGLGLAIARRALVAHGGDLTAANGPDGGALFTARLPLAPPG